MAKKRGRPREVISKRAYIDEYWNKYGKKIENLFKGFGSYSAEFAFKRKAELQIKNDIRFNSKRTAKQALDDFVYAMGHTSEEMELRIAKRNAFNNQDPAHKMFDKISKLNKRIEADKFVDCKIPLADDVNPITNEVVHRTIIGYWEISGSNYVLAQIEGQIDDDSQFTYNEFIDRGLLSV